MKFATNEKFEAGCVWANDEAANTHKTATDMWFLYLYI